MKGNGRRAWRKRERKHRHLIRTRHGLVPASVRLGQHPMWGRRHPTPPQRLWTAASPIPKPFSALSLVGASHSARKRKARAVAEASISSERRAAYAREYGDYRRSGEYLGAYWEERSRFRIGQRVAPCRGCPVCDALIAKSVSRTDWVGFGPQLCDGSMNKPGLIAARSARKGGGR